MPTVSGATRRIRSLVAFLVLLALAVGVPVALAKLAGWPLPRTRPNWDRITTSVQQRDIPAGVVIKTIAALVWIAWAQLMWALVWEIAVNLRRSAGRHEPRPAPLVAAVIGTGAGRLVAMLFAVGLTIATTPAPALARPNVAAAAPMRGGVAPIATAAPSTRADTTVTWQVEQGDTIWDIAEHALGDGSRTNEILELNPTLHSPRNLQIGHVLLLPSDATVPADRERTAAEDEPSSPGTTIVIESPGGGFLPETVVVVQRGDTLWDLAETRLATVNGSPPADPATLDYVHDVIDANPAVVENPNLIFPGEQFTFPALGTPPPPPEPAPTDELTVDEPPTVLPTIPLPAPAGPPPPTAAPSSTTVTTSAGTRSAASTLRRPPPSARSTDSSHTSSTPWLQGITGATVLASGLLLTYRRLRARQAAAGAATLRTAAPTGRRRHVERALVAASDVPLVRWANHELATLFARLQPDDISGAPIAVEFSDTSGLELLWDTPNPVAPTPWEAADGGWAWRLLYDPDLPITATPEPQPLPGLVTIGQRDGRTVMIDLEAFGTIAITGDPTRTDDLLRSIILELGADDDLANTYIHTVGIDIDGTEHLTRIEPRSQTDALAHLHTILADHDRVLADAGLSDTFRLRVGGDAVGRELTVVVLATDTADQAARSPSIAPHRGVVVITTGPPSTACVTIELDEHGLATVRPLNLVVEAAGVPRSSAASVADLFDATSAHDTDDAPTTRSDAVPPDDTDAPDPERDVAPIIDDADLADDGDDWTAPSPDLLVRVLGVPRVDGHPNLGRIELNIVTFLACHGGEATEDQLIDAVWNGRAIERTNLWNRISKARSALPAHLPARQQGSHLVRLHGAMTDLAVLELLSERAAVLPSGAAMPMLTEAVALVDGVPFDAAGFEWAHERQNHAAACQAIETAVLRLADLAIESGEHATARAAITRGLRALPLNERLYRARMRLEAAAGNQPGVRQVFDELVTSLDEYAGPDDTCQPSPQTLLLLEHLLAAVA